VLAVEESDQCTVTVKVRDREVDLTWQEAITFAHAVVDIAQETERHEAELIAADIARVAAQQSRFDVDTAWWCRQDGHFLPFASKAAAEQHKAEEHS